MTPRKVGQTWVAKILMMLNQSFQMSVMVMALVLYLRQWESAGNVYCGKRTGSGLANGTEVLRFKDFGHFVFLRLILINGWYVFLKMSYCVVLMMILLLVPKVTKPRQQFEWKCWFVMQYWKGLCT